MSQFKPTHRLGSGELVELEHKFIYRFGGSEYGLFHFKGGIYGCYPMSYATELPKVIQVAAHEEPEPLRVAPEMQSTYWFIDPAALEGVRCFEWLNDDLDHRILAAGDAYSTKEDAIAALAARQKARGFA